VAKSKRQPSYDLKAADRKRNLAIQIGLTAIVVIFAVALVLYIVMSHEKKPQAGEAKSIRVTSSALVTKEGSSDPKVVLSLYEDFLCPHCGEFEQQFGPTVSKLIDTGAVAADYYMVGILDRPQNQNYSSRAGGAAYCVADESVDAFRRFHAALYAQQPSETAPVYPDNARLVEVARQAGVAGGVPDCINKGRYTEMVQGLAKATGIQATPTVKINGEDYQFSTPDALVAKIKEIVGNVPGLNGAAPPAPAPSALGAPPAAPIPAPAPVPAAPTPTPTR
jgi:protein-disulfide isomerase